MDRLDLNMSELGEQLGIAHTAVRRWIYDGGAPSLKNIDRLAKLFGIRREDVFHALGWLKHESEYSENEIRLLNLIRGMKPEVQEAAEEYLRSLQGLLTQLESEDTSDTEDVTDE